MGITSEKEREGVCSASYLIGKFIFVILVNFLSIDGGKGFALSLYILCDF